MHTSGIICECNPPHGGHRYLFEAARAHTDAAVGVMSGCLTQRGEAAILSPRVRARMLLDMGADAVVELPFPFSAAGGERFAAAGVSILSRLGVQELWFGSECGDLARLREAEEVSGTPEFLAAYRSAARSGAGTAAAYAELLRLRMGGDAPLEPNDLLAVSYLRALRRQGSAMTPHTVRRQGDGFRAVTPGQTAFPSATALRRLFRAEGADALRRYCSPAAWELLRAEAEAGRAPADDSRLGAIFLTRLRTAEPEEFDRVPELGGGIGRRLIARARDCGDWETLLQQADVRCPRSRLRRGMLFALARVTAEDLRAEPAYATLLVANRTGCAALRQGCGIPVVTKRSDLPSTGSAARQLTLTERALGLWALCLPVPVPVADLLRPSAYIAPGGAWRHGE